MSAQIEEIYAKATGFANHRNRLLNHKDKFESHYDALSFVLHDEASKSSLANTRVLVLTEDFCIDHVLNVPLIARLAEASPNAELKLARRDEYREIAATFPGRGGVSRLPTAILLDQDMNALGHWSERSSQDHEWMDAFQKSDPIPEITLEQGRPTPVLASWMTRRFTAQQPFFLDESWRSVRDELSSLREKTHR